MVLLNIFKKKPVRQAQGKERKKEVHEAQEAKLPEPKKERKIFGQAYRVLRKPHVTEKAADLTSQNQYIFEVYPESNKNQVKRAVEDVYGVDVTDVNIINIPRKRKRLGRIEGWRGGYKKAIVRIREGQKIEVLPR